MDEVKTFVHRIKSLFASTAPATAPITQGENNLIYKGWMISSSPDVTPLEHPIYDLWLLGCSNDNTS